MRELGALAAQDLHSHGRFEVAKPQLDFPAPAVEVSDLLGWILAGVHQRGRQRNRFGSVTRAAQAKANDPNGKSLWNFLPPGLRQPAGFIRRFKPGEEPVIFTQPSAFAQ